MGLNKNKGLKSLISDMDAVYSKELGLDENKVLQIKIEKIKPNPYQPRKYFDKEALEELANSIKEYGLIQPIIVLKKGDEFILVAGERRLRASKMLNLSEISALICDADEEKLRELALIENIQRQDLNPIELANSYKNLLEVHKITQEKLASLIHKSRTQITNTMRILNLDAKTQELIASGKITQGHAKVLVGLDKNDEKMVVDSIIGQKLSVNETEKIVKKIKDKNDLKQSENTEFSKELKKLKESLVNLGFECKNNKENIIIYLKNIDKIKKFSKFFKEFK